MPNHMYRAHIVEYPETELRQVFRERTHLNDYKEYETTSSEYMAHVPKNWQPTEEYIQRFDTNDWIEPDTNKWFKSRTPAAKRVELLNAAGYTAIVQRSAPVEWPGHGEEKVADVPAPKVGAAIEVLKTAGLIRSATDLIK